jgi:hypothetical protein
MTTLTLHISYEAVDKNRSFYYICYYIYYLFSVDLQPSTGYCLLWLCSLARAMAYSSTKLFDHTQRRATVSRTPLDEWSARGRDLYLTTHSTQQTNIHVPGGIRTHDRSIRAAVDLRFRPRGHWDRIYYICKRVLLGRFVHKPKNKKYI